MTFLDVIVNLFDLLFGHIIVNVFDSVVQCLRTVRWEWTRCFNFQWFQDLLGSSQGRGFPAWGHINDLVGPRFVVPVESQAGGS